MAQHDPEALRKRAETRSFYNRISHIYDALSEWSEAPLRKMGLQMLAPQPGERILEIGFGTGHCLIELASAVGDEGAVYGIDMADEMGKRAHELITDQAMDQRISILLGDARELPYDSSSFDAGFMSFTLELFESDEIPIVLAEWKRVLKENGRLVIVSLSDEGGYERTVELLEWLHKRFPHYLDCRPIPVGKMLESAGFSVSASNITKHWVPVECIVATR